MTLNFNNKYILYNLLYWTIIDPNTSVKAYSNPPIWESNVCNFKYLLSITVVKGSL